ncbi:MAG TPA: DUF58 domain-containing protein [Dehalococcoidia bacterium]|nr:DUF58 domain-containing protein [Dehalococcoidia bacterium]
MATSTAPALPPRPTDDAELLLKRLDWHVVRRLDGMLQGDYRSMFTGHGFDLAEVREYQAEDDIRYMDWNVTARMDTPYVRQYIEDREITAWLLLDLSPSVDFGTANESKRDLVIDFAGVIARVLTRHGNKVGALLFSTEVDEVMPPRGGELQTLRLIHQLVRPDRRRGAISGNVTDLKAILDRAGQTLQRRSLVFVVSDFIAEDSWEASLGRLSQRHEVIAVWLTDPREEEIPPIGPLVLEDAETGRQVYVDTRDRGFQERFRKLVEERRQRIERIFMKHGVDAMHLSTDGNMVQEIARFAHLRKESRRRAAGRATGGAR